MARTWFIPGSPGQWTVVAITPGGGADGEGGLPPSPVSPGSGTRNPSPLRASSPFLGAGGSAWRYSGMSRARESL